MRYPTLAPVRFLLAALVATLLWTEASLAIEKPSSEAARVRFLIVVDTHDKEGATWGLDGRNLKDVLEAGLKKQKLDGRCTIEMLAGVDVTPARVLNYYQELKTAPNEALVFYYSGHGAYHTARGHVMAFTHGPLFRNDLLAAMRKRKPRLSVLLTDCCANYTGGLPSRPPQGQPPLALPGNLLNGILDGAADIPDFAPPTRPGVKRFTFDESSYLPVADNAPMPAPIHPPRPAGWRAPPPSGSIMAVRTPSMPAATGPVVLRTAGGPLPLKTLMEQADGELLRHLFYRHTGVVDINGCQKGQTSHGTLAWGGSLFTIGFMSLLKDKATQFDTNRNGLVEWREFFPHLQTSCDRAAQAVGSGQLHQVPEATHLGHPVLAAARVPLAG